MFGKVRELARYIKYAFGLGGQTRPTKRWCPDGTPEGSNVSTCLIVNECGHIGERTLKGQFKTTTQKNYQALNATLVGPDHPSIWTLIEKLHKEDIEDHTLDMSFAQSNVLRKRVHV